VDKTASPSSVAPNQVLTFQVVVSNLGPDAAASVTLSDPLPVGTVFLSCVTTVGSCSGPPVGTNGTVTASLGTLNSGASATITITVQVTALSGTLSNTATASSPTPDPDPDNNDDTDAVPVASGAGIPILSPAMLALLAIALGAAALWTLRQPGA
jgi:uncharacterized repeat protein (TIGR01451 family)